LLALIVGGLSVINTMTMAVSERVREIGLKKALGAHTGHVLREYVFEAAVIGLIARALINQPALVLADEPTGAVDTQTSQELLALMRRLNRDEGVTFVIVTHDLELASKADRMIRLKDGNVVSDEILEHDREPVPAGA
jgi:predicted ABC-type transport system involved in lysophospholipase L1 biosynthesis ATPase subunit